jgi:hypothetical protein
MHYDPASDDSDRPALEDTIETVRQVLHEMEVPDVTPDSVIAAPPYYDGRVALRDSGGFRHFNGQIAVKLRFIGYPFDDVVFLTVRELCEKYLRDSYPPIPTIPLLDDGYIRASEPRRMSLVGDQKDFPICFVLGPPRSGTTLLRVMLNLHPELWAPGELHLATFGTMADRADNLMPRLLRHMPIPEAAARCRQSTASFARTFSGWEQRGTPVTEVYEALHEADRDVLIVDKSSPYCEQLPTLERIGEQFPNAKFIHLVRSPHDVIRSYVRLQLHRGNRKFFEPDRNPYQIGEAIWFSCNSNSEAFLTGIPADRKCTIRYEDLVSDPAESLGKVCHLLGRTFDPRMADPYAASTGAIALGAGDLKIHLLKTVEKRMPIEAFYPLGRKAESLAASYGYPV